jgi:hypothetical protein
MFSFQNDVFPLSKKVIARVSKKFPEFVNEIMTSCYTKETMATRSKTGSKGSIGSQKLALNQDEVKEIVG